MLVLAAVARAQEPPAQEPGETQDPLAAMQKLFADHGIALDAKAGTITVRAEAGRPDQPIEYVLIHERGKGHEAMFVCKAKASVLNAAFLALGYEKGENARVVDRDPLPTPEQVAEGAPLFDVFPPKGMEVWFTVRWKKVDDEGRETQVHVPIEDLLLDLSTEKPVVGATWIYLGGHMAPLYRNEPPVFVGDYEGNLISNVYKSPPNHLVTMKHERADDDQVWWVSDAMPATGTPVEFVVHRQKTALHLAREKRLAEAAAAPPAGEPRKDGR
jgi:hypothetical protein